MSERQRREHKTRKGGSSVVQPPKPGKGDAVEAPKSETKTEEKSND